MKRALIITVSLACFVLAMPGCEKGGKKINLRLKYKPGTELTYKQTARGSVKVYYNDSLTRDRFAEIEADLKQYVRRVLEDGTAEVVESKTYHLTSRNKQDSTITDTTGEDREIVLYVQPNGKIVDLELPGEESVSSLSYLKNYYEQGMPVFPDGDLPQGFSWTQTKTVILPNGPMEASTTYEIKSFAREHGYDCVVIGYDGNLVIPLEPYKQKDYELISGVDRIRASGNIYFAYKEGLIVLQRERWLLDGKRLGICSEKNDEGSTRMAIEYDIDHSLTGVEKSK